MTYSPGHGWVCGQCGFCVGPPEPDDDDFETVGELWRDEQERARSMSRPGGGGRSRRRRKYRKVYAPSAPIDDDEETRAIQDDTFRQLPPAVRRRAIARLREMYAKAARKAEKGLIIAQLVRLGYHRKSAIRLLNQARGAPSPIRHEALERAIEEIAQMLTRARSA